MQKVGGIGAKEGVFCLLLLTIYTVPQALIPRSALLFPLIILLLAVSARCGTQQVTKVHSFVALLCAALGALISINFLLLAVAILFLDLLRNISVRESLLRSCYYISVTSVILQLIYFRLTDAGEGGRVGLGTDPNFSGILIFLLCLLGIRVRSRSVYPVLAVGAYFTQSRLLVLLSVALVFLIYVAPRVRPLGGLLGATLRHWFVFFVVINLLVVAASPILLETIEFSGAQTENVFDRVSSVNDASNLGRLAANLYWTNEVLTGQFLFSGIDIESQNDVEGGVLIPHNSFIYAIVNNSFMYIIFVMYIVRMYVKNEFGIYSGVFIVTYMIGSAFLHGLFSPLFLVSFFLVAGPYKIVSGRRCCRRRQEPSS